MMRHEALRYARLLQWPIFPIFEPLEDGSCSCGGGCGKSIGKHPRTRRGVKAATLDVDRIKKWWGLWPDANIGLSTDNGLVLDIDGADGERDLKRLEKKHGKLPKTVEAETSKGRHLFFGVRKKAPSKTHVLGSMQIDSRGEGGYVLLAPSRHASGFVYTWRRSPFDVELADAPRWLENALRCISSQGVDKLRGNSPERGLGDGTRDTSRSGEDARRVHAAMRDGATDDEVRELLLKTSSKAREEGAHYIERTIEWARSFLDESPFSDVRVISARIEQLKGNGVRLTRIRLVVMTRFWRRFGFQVVVPSKSYNSAGVWDTFRAVLPRVKPRELRRLAHGKDVSSLFQKRLEVARDSFGNVRWVRTSLAQ